jgi:hypothetical protein
MEISIKLRAHNRSANCKNKTLQISNRLRLFAKNYENDQVKEDEMGRAYSAQWIELRVGFWNENLNERLHYKDLEVCRRKAEIVKPENTAIAR